MQNIYKCKKRKLKKLLFLDQEITLVLINIFKSFKYYLSVLNHLFCEARLMLKKLN